MNIINIIHIGEQTYRIDELPEETQIKIWRKLNQQALEAIGYKMNQVSVEDGINGSTEKEND